MPPMSTLGPFALRAPLDRGGMGVVWRAVHEASDVPVAIKLIPMPERGAGTRVRDEVRATAALDHPGIVALLDHGEVDTDALDVPRGSLWLAMELVSGGSLVPWLDDLSWEATRRVLLALLDALAHAHARGVVHRDLKPANVLVAGSDDRRPGLRLTDFGIAAVLDAQGAIGQPAGTLHYMAPEQILGHWREYGPWTDLYALGVLAWRITTGRTPYYERRGAAGGAARSGAPGGAPRPAARSTAFAPR
jgi:eukaryotic-like serine/threonine-protein kinase